MQPRELAGLLRARPPGRHRPEAWASVEDAERAAQRRLPRPVFEFVSGGAEDELTLERNARRKNDWSLHPRVLQGVGQTRLDCQVLGERHSLPILLAPTGFTGIVHPDGEVAVARAARREDVVYTVSAAASNTDLDDLVSAYPDRMWFNYYPLADEQRGNALLDRAASLGFRVLVVTVDVPVAGWRERDVRNGLTIPPSITPRTVLEGVRHPGWSQAFLRGPALGTPNLPDVDILASSSSFPSLFQRDLGWPTIRRIRDRWAGPVVLKGVLSVEVARQCVDEGVDAVVVSNHGGRQLDGVPSPFEVLEPIADLLRPAGLEVLLDSGIRRGRDVITAVALGATAVLVGRPYLYGLGAAGQPGVERVVQLLRAELHRSLHLLGLDSIGAVDRSVLARTGGETSGTHPIRGR